VRERVCVWECVYESVWESVNEIESVWERVCTRECVRESVYERVCECVCLWDRERESWCPKTVTHTHIFFHAFVEHIFLAKNWRKVRDVKAMCSSCGRRERTTNGRYWRKTRTFFFLKQRLFNFIQKIDIFWAIWKHLMGIWALRNCFYIGCFGFRSF